MNNRNRQLLTIALGICATAAVHAQDDEITSSLFEAQGPDINIMGFGDVGYISRDGSDADGFAIGQAVAHLSAAMGDSFNVFGEFALTAKEDGYSSGVERLLVRYDFSDNFKLSAGRYHSPIGYWNSSFHHGAWLQTTVSRPEMVKFGSEIVPIHFVGALLEGRIPSGRMNLDYKIGFGNGRHNNISAAGDTGDVNGDKAWMVQVNSKPHDIYGLNAGIGFYNDEIPLQNGTDVKEQSLSAYAAWTKENPEVIVEYLHSTHELLNNSSVSGNVDAWYAQFAYRLSGRNKKWKPYARIERTRVDDSDPLLGTEALDFDGRILGVRWDFNPFAAIKFEYRNEEYDNAGRENNYRVQVSFALAKL